MIGVHPRRRWTFSICKPFYINTLVSDSISVRDPKYADDAVTLARAYESQGEREFEVNINGNY